MEQQPQVQPAEGEQEQRFKTLGVRIDEELHAQLTFIAQLTGSTIADQIRQSVEARVRSAQEDPELIARAEEVRAEIEREAEARKQAIAGLFGKVAVDSEATPPRPGGGRGRRGEGTSAG
jgi:predicted DNA-binding protein